MPLRVALDLAPLLGVPTGVARFTRELTERLAVRADVEIVGLTVVTGCSTCRQTLALFRCSAPRSGRDSAHGRVG